MPFHNEMPQVGPQDSRDLLDGLPREDPIHTMELPPDQLEACIKAFLDYLARAPQHVAFLTDMIEGGGFFLFEDRLYEIDKQFRPHIYWSEGDERKTLNKKEIVE